MFGRQLGWLHATPEGSHAPRIRSYDAPPLPEIDGADYMVEMMQEVGFAMTGYSGPTVLSYSEILAWATLSGARLSAWEAQTIRSVSEAYCGGYSEGSQKGSFPPWVQETEPEDVKQRLKTALQTIKKRKK